MFKKFADRILGEDAGKHTVVGWVAGFTGVILVRLFLELFSDPLPSGLIASKPQSLIAVFFFYLSIVIGLAIIVSFFTKQKRSRVINLILYGLPVIWIAPIIDIVASGGRGFTMAYIFDSHTKLFADFFMFFGPVLNDGRGLTTGIHIELFIIMCTLGWYVWNKRKNIFSTVGALISSYFLIFIMLALPGTIYTVTHFEPTNGESRHAINFLASSIQNSNIPSNTLHGSLSYATPQGMLDFGFDVLIAQILLIITFIFGLLWAFYAYRDTLIQILRNARTERVLFYTSLLALGMYLAYILNHNIFMWVDWVSATCITLSWFGAWMFSVHTNDIADIEIDKVSNPNRPIPAKGLSVETMRDIGFVWLALSLVGAYIAGYYIFYMNIMFLSVYYIYSTPPLRLKQIPFISSFLISLACLATILAGFFFVSPNKMLGAFPVVLAVGIVVVFTLGVNIRDIKDIEGDRKAGIQTLPVLFGKYGKQMVGILLALSFLLLPIFISFYTLYIFAIPSAIIGYKLCTREPYNEKLIFALYFTFCALSIVLILFLLSFLPK